MCHDQRGAEGKMELTEPRSEGCGVLAGSRIVTIRDLGRRIADMRIRLGKTQADLGTDVELSSGYISKIERGEQDGFPVGLLSPWSTHWTRA